MAKPGLRSCRTARERVARRIERLEVALIERAPTPILAVDPTHGRRVTMQVAGPTW